VSVFHHQSRNPGAFAVFQRLNDRMMLAMGIKKVIVHARKIDFIECNSVCGRKRDPIVACNRFGHYLATRPLDNQRMKLSVHLSVSGFVRLHQMALQEDLVAFVKALVE